MARAPRDDVLHQWQSSARGLGSAQVWRDGRSVEVDATELVPGDVVQLSAGDRLPAGVRWLRTHDVQVDESMLTGGVRARRQRPRPR